MLFAGTDKMRHGAPRVILQASQRVDADDRRIAVNVPFATAPSVELR